MLYTEMAGIQIPRFLYGTAWKENETKRLTELALNQGFRGIDTANQRRHYHEAAVGEGISICIQKGILKREELFLQTKFTFLRGQDHRLPYQKNASTSTQVEQSFSSSLEHLQTHYIDSYVLHGPSSREGLISADWDAWRAMEALYDKGLTRFLGISNVNLEQLQELFQKARIRPSFVQNRCYANLAWDSPIREFCQSHSILYQGFSLLTANPQVLNHPQLAQIASRYKRTTNQIIFRFSLEVGMIPLTGTTNAKHMQEDLAIFDFQLTPEEIRQIQTMALS